MTKNNISSSIIKRLQASAARERISLDDLLERWLTLDAVIPISHLHLYQQIVLNASEAVVVADATQPNFPIIAVNPSHEKLTGYSADESIGQRLLFYDQPTEDQRDLEPIWAVIREGREFNLRLRHRRQDGTPFWNNICFKPHHDDKGLVTHVLCTMEDVTSQVTHEHLIEQAAAEAQALFDNAFEPIMIVGNDGRYVQVNTAACDLLETTADQIVGKLVSDFTPLDRLDQGAATWSAFMEGKMVSGEFELLLPNGKRKWIEYRATANFVPGKHASFLREIGGHKQIEQEYRRWQQMFNSGPALMIKCAMHPSGSPRDIFLSPNVEQYGYPASSFPDQRCWFDLLHSEDRDRVLTSIDQARQNQAAHWESSYRIVTTSGEIRWIYDRRLLVYDDPAEMSRGYLLDVTEARDTQTLLQQSTLRYQSVVEALAEGVIVHDAAGQIIACNSSAERILGLRAAELIGKASVSSSIEVFRPDRTEFPSEVRPVQMTLASGQPMQQVVMGIRRLDEREVWLSVNAYPLMIPGHNQPVGVVTSFSDITEQRTVQEALRQSEARFRLLADTLPALVRTFDVSGHCEYVNQRWQEFTGLTLAEVNDDRWFQAIHPDDCAAFIEHTQRVLNHHAPDQIEFRMRRRDGQYAWMSASRAPQFLPDGSIVGYISVKIDITERKQMEQALRESEERFRRLADTAPVLIWTYDAAGHCTYVNQRWQEFTGLTLQEADSGAWMDRIHPEDHEQFIVYTERSVKERQPVSFEYRLRRADGEYRWLTSTSVPRFHAQGEFAGFVGTNTDITERKQIEEALRESESRFRLMADTAPVMIWTSNSEGICTYINQRWQDFTGMTAVHVNDGSWLELIHPDDQALFHEKTSERALKRKVVSFEYRLQRTDGQYRWLTSTAVPRFHSNGEFAGFVGILLEITDLKLAEQRLQLVNVELENRVAERTVELTELNAQLERSEHRYWMLLETSPAAIIVYNPQAEVIYVNRRGADLLGYARDEIMGSSFYDPDWHMTSAAGETMSVEEFPVSRVIATRQPVYGIEMHSLSPREKHLDLRVNAAPLLHDTGDLEAIIVSMEDIAAEKEARQVMEKALSEQQELNEMKNHFLSLISHEFRTPLTVILSNTSIMRMRAEFEADRLDRIDGQVKRLNQMIEDVSTLYRFQTVQQTVKREPVYMADFLEQVIDELQTSQHQSFHIRQKLDLRCHTIFTDEKYFHHIIANLLGNALKYSRPGGTVTIEQNCWPDRVEILICDTGIGIPPDDQSRLFDLFYRASNVGTIRGTGLGLPIARRCAELLGMSISFRSEVNVGTTFIISIPIHGSSGA